MKTIQLCEGTEEKSRYAITMEIYNTGGFKAKGRIRQWLPSKRSMKVKDLTPTQLNKHRVRNKDRQWFNRHLGKEYMRGKEIHHEWLTETCFLFHFKEHRESIHDQILWV